LIGKGDALVAQLLETFKIIHVMADFLGFVRRNVSVELLALMKALQIKIGALGHGFIARFPGKNLLAESAAAQAVNGFEFREESVSLCGELFNGVWHGIIISK
jgi:hypothetical protein